MRVTLQYFESCPNWQVVDQRLKSVIDQNDLNVDLAYRLVESPEDAEIYGFHRSPSILIDGVDPFATAETQVGYACRTYFTEAGPSESPSVEQIAAALGV